MKKTNDSFSVSTPGKWISKIVLAVAVIVLSTGNAWSQEDFQKTRWGVKAGVNFASLSISNSSNNSDNTKGIVGAVGGVTFDYALTSNWYLHSGLEATLKGFKLDINSSGDFKANALYVLLPIETGYMFHVGKGWSLEPRMGFYFAYGVAGNSTLEGASNKIKTFGDKVLKNEDFGVGLGFYASHNRLVMGFHGELGLTKPDGERLRVSGGNAHTSNVSITLGYLF